MQQPIMIPYQSIIDRHQLLSSANLRLEDDAPEETEIRKIEIQIDKEKQKGNSTKDLYKERDSAYERWITRLKNEIAEAEKSGDQQEKTFLEKQRDRAEEQYGPTVTDYYS